MKPNEITETLNEYWKLNERIRMLFTDEHLEILDKVCRPDSPSVRFDPHVDYYYLGRRSVSLELRRRKNEPPSDETKSEPIF